MILDIAGLNFNYASRNILNDVNFSIAPGELLAILGPNGVGKTTLLKCINAMLKPVSGTVMVDDADVLRLDPHQIARRIGYVAQKSEPARLTTFDAVLMGRHPHIRWRVSDRDLKIVDAALKRLGLNDLALRYIDQLSGGELQKICIARALVQEPRLLLLDEPTSSLDLKNQIEILTIMRRVVEEHGVAGVMTMHDLNTALRYAHKFIFLKEGQIYAAGRTNTISAQMINEVYGIAVNIHHLDGFPVVVPHSEIQTHIHAVRKRSIL